MNVNSAGDIVNYIELYKHNVSIRIQLYPLSIMVLRDKEPLVERLSSEYDIEYGGVRRSFMPEIIDRKEDSAILTDKKVGVSLKIGILDEGIIEIGWNAKEELNSVIDAWIAMDLKEWYGQGELRFQEFPLSKHFISGAPYSLYGEEFLARRIQVPLWINRRGYGILIDNYRLFEVVFFGRGIIIKSRDTAKFTYHIIIGRDMRECRKRALRKVGLPQRIPNKKMLSRPIFSTWAYFKKDIDQDKVLEFAREIKEHEFPCSIVEIDDKWERAYGDHEFDYEKFSDPKAMVKKIHELGYLVTLWVHPFINYDSKEYEYAKVNGYLVLDPEEDRPLEVRWWNGEGGLLDISNPKAKEWFNQVLNSLKEKYLIDGFKFDAGDATYLLVNRRGRRLLARTYSNITPNQYTDEWIRFIAENHYDLAEVRVGFLAQKWGVVTREGDKESIWGLEGGLHATITQALTLSITGYPFIMPDMIGGNEYHAKCDKELFIRWVEANILMPIVQFSIPPWRYDEETVRISRMYTVLHEKLAEYYVMLSERAVREGESIVTPLVLREPEDDECACINDEYLVGDILVAPVIERGRNERGVYVPKGKWLDLWTGKEIEGPTRISADAPLDVLPLYVEVNNKWLIDQLKVICKEVGFPWKAFM